jgi:hypothetical protein
MDTNSTAGWGATSENLASKNARNRGRTDGSIPIRVNSRLYALQGAFVVRFLKCSCPSGEAFEEDIDGDQDAVFLADEVSGMDVVHADSGGDVLEDGGDR